MAQSSGSLFNGVDRLRQGCKRSMDNPIDNVIINNVIGNDNIIDFPIMGASNDAYVDMQMAA